MKNWKRKSLTSKYNSSNKTSLMRKERIIMTMRTLIVGRREVKKLSSRRWPSEEASRQAQGRAKNLPNKFLKAWIWTETLVKSQEWIQAVLEDQQIVKMNLLLWPFKTRLRCLRNPSLLLDSLSIKMRDRVLSTKETFTISEKWKKRLWDLLILMLREGYQNSSGMTR